MAAVTAAVPTLSQIHSWSTEHLETAATHWSETAATWEHAFTVIHREASNPGGTQWIGAAADAAVLRTGTDKVVVVGVADTLHAAAQVARDGAQEIVGARELALQAVNDARAAGFTIGEDLSVTSRTPGPPALMAAREAQAQVFAAAIRTSAENLVAIDTEVAGKVSAAIGGVNTAQFGDTPVTPNQHKKPQIQPVDNRTFKQGPPQPDPGTPDDPVGGVDRHPIYPDHRPNGKWAPANSGADGDAAAQHTFDQMEQRGIPVVRQEIRVSVTDPQTGKTYIRYYDGLQPTGVPGQYIGIEHKTNASPITENQSIADSLVNSGNAARGTLNGQPIDVVGARTIRVSWPPPEGLPTEGLLGRAAGPLEGLPPPVEAPPPASVEPLPAAPRFLPPLAGGPNGAPGMPNLVELPHSHPGELPTLGQDLIPGERAAEEP
jgi:hypothetical protein